MKKLQFTPDEIAYLNIDRERNFESRLNPHHIKSLQTITSRGKHSTLLYTLSGDDEFRILIGCDSDIGVFVDALMYKGYFTLDHFLEQTGKKFSKTTRDEVTEINMDINGKPRKIIRVCRGLDIRSMVYGKDVKEVAEEFLKGKTDILYADNDGAPTSFSPEMYEIVNPFGFISLSDWPLSSCVSSALNLKIFTVQPRVPHIKGRTTLYQKYDEVEKDTSIPILELEEYDFGVEYERIPRKDYGYHSNYFKRRLDAITNAQLSPEIVKKLKHYYNNILKTELKNLEEEL